MNANDQEAGETVMPPCSADSSFRHEAWPDRAPTSDRQSVSPKGCARLVWGQALRRLGDVCFSTMVLLLAFPLFLVIACAVRLDSPGPILFTQRRVGKDGREFSFYKFRSMIAGAEAQRKALEARNERDGPVFKIKDDPRITRVGRFLRRCSLDELPQILNVLKGDMSLIGPRPALPHEVAHYTAHERGRLAVLPGITGLWQVSGRAELSFERSIELDLHYIRYQSLRLDLKILVKTVSAVLTGHGAY